MERIRFTVDQNGWSGKKFWSLEDFARRTLIMAHLCFKATAGNQHLDAAKGFPGD